MALERGGRQNQAAVSQYRFSLWTKQGLTTLRALVLSKTHKHIFLGKEEERKQRKNLLLSPKLASGTDPDRWGMSSHSMGPREDKWARLFLALLTDPCLVSEFSATS